MRRSLRSHVLASAVAATSAAILVAGSATSVFAATSTPTPTPKPSVSASATAASTITLTTKTHSKPRPKKFTKFSYQTGKLKGANHVPQRKMNKVLAKDVRDTVNTARKENKGSCNAGAKRCAYFSLTLAAPTCQTGYVCITETSALQAPGANDVNEGVNTLVFDSKTGDNVGLNTFVSEKQTDAFLKAADAGIAAALTKGGISPTDKTWKPNQRLQDIQGWNATPEGIHLYYAKYAVAPGSFGIVDFTVPWSAINA